MQKSLIFIVATLVNFGILANVNLNNKVDIKTDTSKIVQKTDTTKTTNTVTNVDVKAAPINWTDIVKSVLSMFGGILATIILSALKARYPGTFAVGKNKNTGY